MNKVKIQLLIGVPLLLISGILTFWFPNLTGFQYIFLRVVLSLGIAIIGEATLEGSVKVNWTLSKKLGIVATGWIAIFLLLYYNNPPLPPM